MYKVPQYQALQANIQLARDIVAMHGGTAGGEDIAGSYSQPAETPEAWERYVS